MPFARIDEMGIILHYTDSGAPPGASDYTTVVLVHGATINSGIFERMFPYATKHGLRLIAMNMRDYAGSTPYTTAELAAFVGDDVEVQASAVRSSGRELAGFLVYVCQVLKIPARTMRDGKAYGGLAFLTWSFGTMGLLSIFGDPKTLDDAQRAALQPYLRTAFAHDPPAFLYGEDPDVGLPTPFNDPTVLDGEMPAAFGSWVSGYYTAVPDVAHITPEVLHARREERPPTLHAMAAEDSERIFEPDNLFRACATAMQVPLSVHRHQFHRTLFDTDPVFPDVKVVALWCDRAPWPTVWSAKVLHELLQEQTAPGQRRRDMSLVKIEGANHVYHWDEPERMVQILCENI
ncbi:uncharacterized protein PHACADRAFT_213982 [Phanerochaete carnosa HHB-10118-sp]|uniref:Uncharacterized protein n=1 Tax=Phanerochaete carnosa (strain HHB-10118-sp) TaxID=650164 RepID=K5VUH7_PHACS|nr:uncharacterized protein PHACADRAFT_213982 [Phanerochaete carnosa HHB-10118-sp]EKM50239.1 hypothetical protein PHACADRAFT_213982 [Phanerochaete carnosa HHB-10118-sp]